MPEHTPAPTPARSLYGFFMYLFLKTLSVIYLAWAFLPEEYFHYLNIYYYPLKYWASAVPIQCLLALALFAFIIYPSSNLMLTPHVNSVKTITDGHAQYTVPSLNNLNNNRPTRCICKDVRKCSKHYYYSLPKDLSENTVMPLHDINISVVCKKLYLINKTQ